ncbi:MAG: HD domain-containing protein [Candidatus Marinimicrobia bacterium]|nr:HD domain-containing protein [Candidatus Neomarinimicrobiota bacterium]
MANIQSLISTDRKFHPICEVAGILGDKLGIEVYVVGGYVRDLIIGRKLHDLDIMVVGDGIEFARQLAKVLSAGSFGRIKNVIPFERFGTAAIPYQDGQIEVASARKEVYQFDSRKPAVSKTDLEGDLSRRDFNINAMAVSINRKNFGDLFDPYGGIRDLKAKIIRTPLDPDSTFSDDPLRMMRAVRFAAQLQFNLDQVVIESIERNVRRIEIVSSERITAEFYKILGTDQPSIGLELLQHAGLMKIIFPEISEMFGLEQPLEWHHKDIFYHTLQVVDNIAEVSDNLDLRFAGLVHDIGKPRTRRLESKKGWTFHGHDFLGAKMLETIAQRMHLSNKTKDYLQKLVNLHLRPIALAKEGVTDAAIRRLMVDGGDETDDLMILCRADITSKNPNLVRKYLGNFERVDLMMHDVQERDAMRAFQSPVRGDVIMKECGLKPGPVIGRIKKRIENAILEGEIENSYEAAFDYLNKIKDEYVSK